MGRLVDKVDRKHNFKITIVCLGAPNWLRLLYHITWAVQCVLTYIRFNSQRRVTVTSGRPEHIRQNFILAPYYISIKGFSQIRIRTPKHLIIMKVRFDPHDFPPEFPRRWYLAAVYWSATWSGCLCPAKYLGSCNCWYLRGLHVFFVPTVTIFPLHLHA